MKEYSVEYSVVYSDSKLEQNLFEQNEDMTDAPFCLISMVLPLSSWLRRTSDFHQKKIRHKKLLK